MPKPVKRISARKYHGMGDVVEAVAKPVVRVIDRVAGTHLEGCEGCAKRRAALNRIMPFGEPAEVSTPPPHFLANATNLRYEKPAKS